jgi:hypothetical protein
MWEIMTVVVIVGVVVFFSGRSLVRSLRGDAKGGCAGCAGCSTGNRECGEEE